MFLLDSLPFVRLSLHLKLRLQGVLWQAERCVHYALEDGVEPLVDFYEGERLRYVESRRQEFHQSNRWLRNCQGASEPERRQIDTQLRHFSTTLRHFLQSFGLLPSFLTIPEARFLLGVLQDLEKLVHLRTASWETRVALRMDCYAAAYLLARHSNLRVKRHLRKMSRIEIFGDWRYPDNPTIEQRVSEVLHGGSQNRSSTSGIDKI